MNKMTNEDRQRTLVQLERTLVTMHGLHQRHVLKVGEVAQPEFGAIFTRAYARLEGLHVIYGRLYDTSFDLNAIDAEIETKWPGIPLNQVSGEPEFVHIMDRHQDLVWKFQLDHDSMLVFGALFLDDWVQLVALALGLDRTQFGTFETFLNLVQGNQCPRALSAFRESELNGVGSYLCLALRAFRNKLVIHQEKTWQRGVSRHPKIPLVFVNYTVPEQLLPLPEVVDQQVASIRKRFKDRFEIPEDAKPQDVATWLLGHSTLVKSQSDREAILNFVVTYGVTNPMFQLVFQRFTQFVNEASPLC